MPLARSVYDSAWLLDEVTCEQYTAHDPSTTLWNWTILTHLQIFATYFPVSLIIVFYSNIGEGTLLSSLQTYRSQLLTGNEVLTILPSCCGCHTLHFLQYSRSWFQCILFFIVDDLCFLDYNFEIAGTRIPSNEFKNIF